MSKFSKRDIKTMREAVNLGLSIWWVQPNHVMDLHSTGVLDLPKKGKVPASAEKSRVLALDQGSMYYLIQDTDAK